MADSWFVVIEGIEFEDLVIGPFPDVSKANDWMENSWQVELFVQEDCSDCYTTQFPNDQIPGKFAQYEPVRYDDEPYPEHPLEQSDVSLLTSIS